MLHREVQGETLTGKPMGQPLSREIRNFSTPMLLTDGVRKMPRRLLSNYVRLGGGQLATISTQTNGFGSVFQSR